MIYSTLCNDIAIKHLHCFIFRFRGGKKSKEINCYISNFQEVIGKLTFIYN